MNVNSIDVGKAKVLVEGTLPPNVVQSMSLQGCNVGGECVARKRGALSWRDPLEEEVIRDIHRRIELLGKSGKMFEDGMQYSRLNNRDVADAECIVRGVDPATLGCSSAGRFVTRRKIAVEKRHWVACKVGHYMTQYGVAYVHADGSIAIFRHGEATQCKCGAVHVS